MSFSVISNKKIRDRLLGIQRHIHQKIRWATPHCLTNFTLNRVPIHPPPSALRVGNQLGPMQSENRLNTRNSGCNTLCPPGESGEKMWLDESQDNSLVCLQIRPVQVDRCPTRGLSHFGVQFIIVGIVIQNIHPPDQFLAKHGTDLFRCIRTVGSSPKQYSDLAIGHRQQFQ